VPESNGVSTNIIVAGRHNCADDEYPKLHAGRDNLIAMSEGKMTDTGTGDKVGPTLAIKPLTECSAGELIRLASGAWAIVANDSSAKRIFVISGDEAPLIHVLPEDSTEACLSYGTGFRVASVHASFVGMHTYGHEGFDPVGKLIVSRPFEHDGRTGRYFAARAGQPRFLDLDNFQIVAEPLGHRALFRDWEVSVSRPGHPEPVARVKSPVH
jgi:hypothetical protein